MISASIAKLAVTPPIVGSHSTAIYKSPASECSLTAPEVLAICISERMPSCMRAPPDRVKPITGRPSLAASSNRRVIFSPTATPMEPSMKPGSIAKTAASIPSTAPRPQMTPSFSPLSSAALASFSP